MANVQLAVAGDETTQVILSVPGVQGPAGSNLPPSGTTHQLLYKQSNTNYDTAWKLITNDNVDAAAAIAGAKISPNFGSQNVLTTGTSTAASFIPTSSGVPTNGLYLPSANNVALSTNGTGRLFVDATGKVTVNQATDGVPSINIESDNDGRSRTILRFTDTDVATAANQPLGVIQFFGSDTSGAGAGIKSTIGAYSESANGDSYLTFSTATSALNNQERLRITSAGLVGIGTNIPGATLHVEGFGNTVNQRIFTSDNVLNATASLTFGTTPGSRSKAAIRMINVNTGNAQGALSLLTDTGTSGLVDRLYIDGNGRVGIGTTSPVRLFHALDSANSIVGRVESGQSSSWLQFAASGTGTASRIGDPGGSVNAGLAFMTADTERARIDSSGRLLVGTNAARTLASYGSAGLQVESTAFATASISAVNNQNTADGVALMLGKSRGAAVGSFTVVQSGDQIGGIYFQGADGAAMRSGASVVAVVDAAPAYAATALVNGQTYRIVTVGTTDFTLIGASANTVGTVFTATGPGTGTGTAILNAGNMPGRLVFSTTADGSVSPTERMRINSAGLVGVGTSSPVVDLDVAPAASTATFRIHARSNTTPVAAIELVRGTNTTFGADGNGDYRIKNDTGNLSFEYGDGGITTERARITSAGQLRLAGAGITFNGDTATANELDDYEEGTWTPAYQTSNSDISITSTTVSHAVYTKIGNRVFCTCRFFSNVASVGTGTVRVTGLPFTSASSQGDVSCVISFAARFSTAAPVTATVRSSATQLDLLTVYTDATLGGGVTYMPAANLRAATASSNIISISFNYIV